MRAGWRSEESSAQSQLHLGGSHCHSRVGVRGVWHTPLLFSCGVTSHRRFCSLHSAPSARAATPRVCMPTCVACSRAFLHPASVMHTSLWGVRRARSSSSCSRCATLPLCLSRSGACCFSALSLLGPRGGASPPRVPSMCTWRDAGVRRTCEWNRGIRTPAIPDRRRAAAGRGVQSPPGGPAGGGNAPCLART